jgi:hypothetical protein
LHHYLRYRRLLRLIAARFDGIPCIHRSLLLTLNPKIKKAGTSQ